ncbi:uncharacterized protein [Musca autumnalis]|uniref:uncharacterized protein n=1 Tax=Musca autumnalis TaxID=221902 RepID=UPI003CF83EE7
MVRETLMAELRKLGVPFPDTATVPQLRELLREIVGDGGAAARISGGEAEVQQQAVGNKQKNTVASTNEQGPTCEQATTSQLAHTDTHPITVEQERVCEQVAANAQEAMGMYIQTDEPTGSNAKAHTNVHHTTIEEKRMCEKATTS